MSSSELTLEDLKSHSYVIGGTRTGKTNLQLFLLNCLYMKQNQQKYPCSTIYIDPHGDASLQLARMQRDWKDLVILDPLYTTYALNPLELPPLPDPLSSSYSRERTMAVQNQVEQMSVVMREMFSTSSDQAPRLMWMLKGALYYLYAGTDPGNNAASRSQEEIGDEFVSKELGPADKKVGVDDDNNNQGKKFYIPPGAPITFLDLYYLLNEMIRIDKEELEVLLKSQLIPDEVVSRTMEAISKLEDSAFAAAMNRISNFVLPLASITARTFCRRESKLDFADMLKPGRLTIFRIPKSNLPEDFSAMLTSAIVLRIYFMVQARARELERSGGAVDSPEGGGSNRTAIYVFIDEFQSIAKLGILSTILSESAKFGLYLNIAHQNISQIPDDLFDAIIGNAGMVFAFRLGPDDARTISKVMAPDEEKWAKSIVRLPNWLSVVRMNPRGDSALARTLTFEVPKVAEPLHTQREVIDYMRQEMEIRYGSGYELSTKDREPIYKATMEEATSAKGLPVLRPVEENILYVIDSRRLDSKEIKFRSLAKIMQEQFGWNLSVTLGAVNSLVDKGYLHDLGIFYDPSLVGKSDEATLNEDEKDRSRETSFALTDFAKNGFLSKDIRGPRSGRNIHWNMLRHLIHYYRERKGFSCTIDYGESNKRWPDIIVYPLKTSFIKDREGGVKEAHDPNHWDIKNRFAVEVETTPRKNQRQLLKNYYKSVYPPGQYAHVVFYVASQKHKKDVLDLLKTKPSTTYDVRLMHADALGMNEEDLQKELSIEEEDASAE
jgi:hypothetical protein